MQNLFSFEDENSIKCFSGSCRLISPEKLVASKWIGGLYYFQISQARQNVCLRAYPLVRVSCSDRNRDLMSCLTPMRRSLRRKPPPQCPLTRVGKGFEPDSGRARYTVDVSTLEQASCSFSLTLPDKPARSPIPGTHDRIPSSQQEVGAPFTPSTLDLPVLPGHDGLSTWAKGYQGGYFHWASQQSWDQSTRKRLNVLL